MKQTRIAPGYRITVKSWENDGDNYNTAVVEGLSKEDALFVYDFAKLFDSKSRHRGGIGNLYDPSSDELASVQQATALVVAKHPNISDELKEYFTLSDEDSYYQMDYAYDLHLSGGEFYTRVCESVKVEFIPNEILIDDVTEDFNNG